MRSAVTRACFFFTCTSFVPLKLPAVGFTRERTGLGGGRRPTPRAPASPSPFPSPRTSSRGLRFLPPFKERGFSPLEATFFSFLESAQRETPVFLFQFLLRPPCFPGRSGWGRGPRAAGQDPGSRLGSWSPEAPVLLFPGPDPGQHRPPPSTSSGRRFALSAPMSAAETSQLQRPEGFVERRAQGGAGARWREHRRLGHTGAPALPTVRGRNPV